MKAIITSAVIAMAASQVQAEGFYQDVAASNSAERIEIRVNAPSDFVSPLYRAITGDKKVNVRGNTVADNTTTYSILYKTVTGNPQAQDI